MCKYFYIKTSTSLMKRIGSNKLWQTCSTFFLYSFSWCSNILLPKQKISRIFKVIRMILCTTIKQHIIICIYKNLLFLLFFLHTFVAFEVLATVKPQRFRFITRQIYSIMTGEVIALILFLSGEIMLL